jgi:alkylation response protein AidB-like acyl-CoA dehydrogenase
MDFAFTEEEEAFRRELRAFLAAELPSWWRGMFVDDPRAIPETRRFCRKLAARGWLTMAWPREWGGQEASVWKQAILREEMWAHDEPRGPQYMNLNYIGPCIMGFGTEAQQRRFLPPMAAGEVVWTQGFSEPGAGSDLAALTTRAEERGDHFVVNGQKVWSSYADAPADWCFLLARTDPSVPKHRGLSVLAVPMRQPGIEQRPLRMINGITKEFGEVLFDGARVPAENMIGEPGEGWPLAMTVVSHEREPGELGYVSRYRKLVKELAAIVRAEPERYDDARRRDLGWAIVDAEMLRHHVSRRLSDRLDGIEHGPEGSVDKLLMTQAEQSVGHAALSVGGAGHVADDTWLKVYLYSRAQSVMGGTSQIQRNLVARRILGLPT